MTTNDPAVVAICGSLRAESRTRVALARALEAASAAGVRTEMLDLRTFDLRGVYADGGSQADVEELTGAVAAADGLLVGTPNYHDSYSGTLKVALDHCGRDEFADTIVGLVEVAGGRFPGAALAHLRNVCRELDAWTLPDDVAIPRASETVDPGGVADDEIARRLGELGRDLARHASADGLRAAEGGLEA